MAAGASSSGSGSGSGSKSSGSPRTVADATRFTSNRPHASAKPTSSSTVAGKQQQPQPQPQQQTSSRRPASASTSTSTSKGTGAAAATAIPRQETLDERVRRLRAAHLAAKQHDVSRMDHIIARSRRFFDAAHRFTVLGLIGFSGIAFLVTVYAAVDMITFNRKRRNEFFALQRQMRQDSLEAARLAYMAGTATDEQVALVEEARARANASGVGLPSILSAPQSPAPPGGRNEPVAPTAPTVPTTTTTAEGGEKPRGRVTGWLFGGLKKEDDVHAADGSWRNPTAATTSQETVGDVLRDKAKAAFDSERDNQQRGGPLDQIGLDSTTAAAAAQQQGTDNNSSDKKKGWW